MDNALTAKTIDAGFDSVAPRFARLITANSLVPISSLPSELLSYIFRLGQAMDFAIVTLEAHLRVLQSFEVLVSHVSSRFRAVALGTPVLWSRITIAPTFRGEEIDTYLTRSAQCGLKVRMNLASAPSLNTLQMEKVDIMVPHLRQFERLAINTTYESRLQPILRRLYHSAAPMLQHLSVAVDEVESVPPEDDKILQGGAPILTFVRLRGLALHLFRPPLTNVTTLHLDETTGLPMLYTTFREIITAPSILYNLSVYGDLIAPQTNTNWDTNVINLPYLRHLRICGVGGAIYSGLLINIRAPALESLVLKDLKEGDLSHFWASEYPIATRFPLLSSLTFLDSDVSCDEYLEMFHVFPDITSFTAAYEMRTPTLLQLLSTPQPDAEPSRDPKIMWPRLQTLTLLVNLHDMEHVIVDVVERRKALRYPLTKLRLGIPHPLSELSQYAWLKENVALERLVEHDGWPKANAAFDADPDDNLFA
ncbi:hypothetical protein DXG03_007338 [Asterophora parasitica]|uniref:F-box domain-containing protein n=1 Tax=Asterophora parasitica TaxID=117018 RepID=A0A9P7KAU5_9AGAR|nr:hypothetical protein DXG03_007338 [Asterophora parasitica]